MEKLFIKKSPPLRGEVQVSGSKNSVLPILAATLLTEETSVVENVPHLMDVITMCKILASMGVKVEKNGSTLKITPGKIKNCEAPYKLVSTMRASFCVLGPLLGKEKHARVSLPGGCVIGLRPVDLHLKGLKALGAKIELDKGYVVARAPRLRGNTVFLGGAFGSSVLATGNVMMAATLARGRTTIENAACEPEVVDLAVFLKKMGAKIKGEGTPTIEVDGVKQLRGVRHTVIPDRIEAGTLMLAAVITRGEIFIKDAVPSHLGALIDKLRESNIELEIARGGIAVSGLKKRRPVDITTLAFPGFPTDLQAQMMATLALTDGISVITEKIYPDRFMHIPELNRMGGDIRLEGSTAVVKGKKTLIGAEVMASDLRASAALVLAGVVAKGSTLINRIYHLDRGYDKLEEKLKKLGALIERIK
jgi:UDP-N-acetylglucosamine 1-carboxyvinyltransferase